MYKKIVLWVFLILFTLSQSGCIGSIILLTVLYKKKQARQARQAEMLRTDQPNVEEQKEKEDVYNNSGDK